MFPNGISEILADSSTLFPSQPIPSGAQEWKGCLVGCVIMQAIFCFLRFAIDDLWGGVTDFVLLIVSYFVIFDMTVMYLLWYMVLCGMNFSFNMVYLSCRVVELKKDFFSKHHHPMENLTSLVVLCAPIMAGFGCYVSYQMYSYWEPFIEEEGYGQEYGSNNCYRQQLPPQPAIRHFSGTAHRLSDVE